MALADNKTKIQALLAGINALPEAGSGEAPAPVLQEKSVTPTKTAQSVMPDTGFDALSKVNVGAIPDEYIIPTGTKNITENGEHDVAEFESVNVVVESEPINLQEKSVTPSKSTQTIEPDDDHDGLSKVTVNPIPSEYIVPSGTVSVTENGTHNVREAESVSVNVPAPEFKTQEKTVTPTTSKQTVTPDAAYDGLSEVTVNAMPTATQATPSIEVSDAGLITAKATQNAGYVVEGTKSATKQLTTQGAQTITPGTADKTIASGRYLTGTQTIKGDANLVAGNIKSGVSIFGVAGSYAGSGDGTGGVGATLETGVATPFEIVNEGDTVEYFWRAEFNISDLGFDLSAKQMFVLTPNFFMNNGEFVLLIRHPEGLDIEYDNCNAELVTDTRGTVLTVYSAMHEGDSTWGRATYYAI